jgi:hypothetical protein
MVSTFQDWEVTEFQNKILKWNSESRRRKGKLKEQWMNGVKRSTIKI